MEIPVSLTLCSAFHFYCFSLLAICRLKEFSAKWNSLNPLARTKSDDETISSLLKVKSWLKNENSTAYWRILKNETHFRLFSAFFYPQEDFNWPVLATPNVFQYFFSKIPECNSTILEWQLRSSLLSPPVLFCRLIDFCRIFVRLLIAMESERWVSGSGILFVTVTYFLVSYFQFSSKNKCRPSCVFPSKIFSRNF